MAAYFLAALTSEGRTVVTILRTDQSEGLESFQEVGEFFPLQVDQQGKVIREVALARIALIRARRRLLPKAPSSEEEGRPLRWDEKPDGTHEYWLDEGWQAPLCLRNRMTAIRRCCVQKSRKSSRISQLDAPSAFVYKVLLSFHF